MLLPLLDDPRTPCSTMLHCGARSHKREITNRSTEIGVVWVGKAIWIRKENLHTRKKKKSVGKSHQIHDADGLATQICVMEK